MDSFDLAVRRHVYATVAADGRPPTAAETAAALDADTGTVRDAYLRLHDAHAFVLREGSTELWAANPFCFVPRPHRVSAGGRAWTGTCCWDALGIPAALHADGIVDTECACCGDPLRLEVADGALVDGAGLLAHVLVPASRWWDDVGFT